MTGRQTRSDPARRRVDGLRGPGSRVPGWVAVPAGGVVAGLVLAAAPMLDLDATLVTFSPSQGRYVTHEVELDTLVVTPGREGSGEIQSFAQEPDGTVQAEPVELRGPWTWGFATTPRIGLAVPLLAAGNKADDAVKALTALGFSNVRAVGKTVGRASAIKLCAAVGVPF